MKEQNNENIALLLVKSGILEIDKNGAIWRVRGGRGYNLKNRFLKTKRKSIGRLLPNGYLQIRVLVDGKRYHCYAHRIVWIYFNGEIPKNLEINHIDGNKTNNNPNNLEVVTRAENRKHASESLGCWNGERNGRAKLAEKDVVEIRKRYYGGDKLTDIVKDYCMNYNYIGDVARGKFWKHITIEKGGDAACP